MSGPFETEDQARLTPAVRAAYEAMRTGKPGDRSACLAILAAACAAAGVELGAYDASILRWLANYEPQMCAVVAGLVARAAGRDKPEAAQLAEIRLVLDAFDWETDDRQYALEQIGDIANRGVQDHVCPEGTWHFSDHGEIYAAHPDGTAHAVGGRDER